MNSRFVPITIAMLSFAVAAFFAVYFNSLWRWLVASPVLVFVTWPAIKLGFFASQAEVDRMTGADKFYDPINPFLLAIEILSFSRYIIYGVAVYLGLVGFSFYVVPLLGAVLSLAKASKSIRFNIAHDENGFPGILKTYLYFYIPDVLTVGIIYGICFFVGKLF